MPMLMSQFSPVRIVATYTQAQGSQQERSHCRRSVILFTRGARIDNCVNNKSSTRAYVLRLMFSLAYHFSYAHAYVLVKTSIKKRFSQRNSSEDDRGVLVVFH